MAPALERLRLRRFASEDGEELVDLPRAPLPDPETPAPVRLLGTWDAILLAHARRANVLPERFRDRVFHVRMPQSVTTFLVDGAVAGTWRHEDGRVTFDPFERLDRATLRALREEGERMAALHAEASSAPRVRCSAALTAASREGGWRRSGRSPLRSRRRFPARSLLRTSSAFCNTFRAGQRGGLPRTSIVPAGREPTPWASPKAVAKHARLHAEAHTRVRTTTRAAHRRRLLPLDDAVKRAQRRRDHSPPACTASTASSVSASAAALSGRWRSTRAKRSVTPPG